MAVLRAIHNLTAGTKYVFRIRSYSALGVPSNWAESITYTTPIGSAPNAPANLVADFTSPDLILNWSPPITNIDGSPAKDISYYSIQITALSSSQIHTSQQPSFVFNFQQNALDFGTAQPQLEVSVTAVDVAGNTSAPVLITAINDVPPASSVPSISTRSNLVVLSMTIPDTVKDFSNFIIEESIDNSSWTVLNSFVVGTTYTDQVTIGSIRYYRYSVEDVFNQIGPPSVSANASILGGSIQILAPNGHPALILGYQPDGSIGLGVYDPLTDTKVMQAGQGSGGLYGLSVLNKATNIFQLVSGTSTAQANATVTTSSLYPTFQSFGDEPSVTVTIGGSGQALISFGAHLGMGGDNDEAFGALTIDGSTVDGSSNLYARIEVSSAGVGLGMSASVMRELVISGLSPGSHTFSMAYACLNGTHGISARERILSVSPF